ncbi:MAG: neutral zinc metallopeptidase [Steroidobacteraceae bacterium]
MRTDQSRRSENIEDYRGRRFGGKPAGIGIGGILIALALAYFFNIDPRTVLGMQQAARQMTQPQGGEADGPPVVGAPTDAAADFVAAVLGDTEDTWGEIFQAAGERYPPPKLVLFSEQVSTGCGFATSGAGPFYCPADQKVYIDLSFYDQLEREFQAPGDFARAYVLAHEVGHHVQTIIGTSAKVRAAQQRGDQEQANQLQVRMELQADCYAGIWANHANRSRQILEEGDIEEGLQAASAVGDDTIQRRVQGHVVPESFTHGSARQRMEWFQRGLQSGSMDACNTFQ